MSDGSPSDSDDESILSRRSALRGLATGAVALAGLGATAGNTAANHHPVDYCVYEYRHLNDGLERRECCQPTPSRTYCTDWQDV